ncbi:MAG: hypothetical protein ACTSU5_02355 [Promethearchaeota archaeon]
MNELTTFIALWDEAYGPKVLELFPETDYDVEPLAINIFVTFETVFGSALEAAQSSNDLASKVRIFRRYIQV